MARNLELKIKSAFKDSFIFFQPRDIVSGDFYWYSETNPKPIYEEVQSFDGVERVFKGFEASKKIIAAVDCTGHGVPGAFMSMVGHQALNKIVRQNGIHEPNLILKELNSEVKSLLSQDQNQSRDGMDMACEYQTFINKGFIGKSQ